MSKFTLNSKLEHDSFFVADLDLAQLRLINNSDYTWLILIPRITDVLEMTDLEPHDYNKLCGEIRIVAKTMQELFKPDKLNIASIGNVVKQLHVHIIGRFEDDKLFPKPLWGAEFTPYLPDELELKINKISAALKPSH